MVKITKYDDKIALSLTNLVEITWLTRYPRPREITYDQESEIIGHKIRKYLIEMEYGIKSKPSTSRNPISNKILERITQVLGILVWTYNN